MLKILLTGHGGSSNRGSEAIVRCTIDVIRRYLGSTDITILSFDPASDRSVLLPELGDVCIPDVQTPKPRKYSLRWLPEVLERRVIRRVWPGIPSYFSLLNRSLYYDVDIVISTGGDNFWYEDPSHFFGELALARSFGALTVVWAASIGPFTNSRLERIWANRLRQVDLITVRDSMSLEYLRTIGVIENVKRVADPAFVLPTNAEGAISLSSYESNRTVGIGMSALISRFGLSYDKYISAFTSFGKMLLSDANTQLVLIPHVVQEGNNDELVCQQIASKLPNNTGVTLISGNHNACQIKNLIAQCDYFIGARTHSTIASLSSCVPTLSTAYSPKAFGINRSIFGHTDYVLPISDLTEKSLMKKFMLLCNNRQEIIKQLARRIPEIKRMAERGGEYLAEMLRRNHIV